MLLLLLLLLLLFPLFEHLRGKRAHRRVVIVERTPQLIRHLFSSVLPQRDDGGQPHGSTPVLHQATEPRYGVATEVDEEVERFALDLRIRIFERLIQGPCRGLRVLEGERLQRPDPHFRVRRLRRRQQRIHCAARIEKPQGLQPDHFLFTVPGRQTAGL